MFIVKIYHEKKLLHIIHYRIFQNLIADIRNETIFENLPKELVETLGEPRVRFYSDDDHYKISYKNGVVIYISKICFKDDTYE